MLLTDPSTVGHIYIAVGFFYPQSLADLQISPITISFNSLPSKTIRELLQPLQANSQWLQQLYGKLSFHYLLINSPTCKNFQDEISLETTTLKKKKKANKKNLIHLQHINIMPSQSCNIFQPKDGIFHLTEILLWDRGSRRKTTHAPLLHWALSVCVLCQDWRWEFSLKQMSPCIKIITLGAGGWSYILKYSKWHKILSQTLTPVLYYYHY